MEKTSPTLSNGKVSYMEIPAVDIKTSSIFYKKVFGWDIRQRSDGRVAFNDTVNEVSGTWVTTRKPVMETGILVYIMVDDIERTIESIIANGGNIVQPVGKDLPEITARFSDPAGNIFGIFQQ